MKKLKFYTELSYVFGLIFIALAATLMTEADYGLSMIVAPAYLLHVAVSRVLPFFSFGMAEYTFQAVLLVVMIIVVRKFKVSYLFSFVTAVLYGFILDGFLFLFGLFELESVWARILFYVLGLLSASFGVALVFHTYVSPEVYELFVKEFSDVYKKEISKVKLVYDIISCVVAVIMSFAIFGLFKFEGVKWGTVVSAVVTGPLVKMFSKILESVFDFSDGLKLRKFFEK